VPTEMLSEQGADARDVDRGCEAIALHTSSGIAERRGLPAYLTREGIDVDLQWILSVAALRQ